MPQRTLQSTRAVIFMLSAAVLFAAVYALKHTVSCFLLALVLAYLLDPFVVMLERRKLPRVWGIMGLYAVLLFFSVFLITYLIPFLTIRWEAFVHDLPAYILKVKGIIAAWKARLSSGYGGQEWAWLFDAATGNIDKLVNKIGTGVYAAASSVVFNLFNLLLAPILIFFMLFYKMDILAGIKGWLPVKRRAMLLQIGGEINRSIGGYIRGQLMVSGIVAVLSAAALLFLDVDYPIFNGIFAGLASVLPFIGVILATIPALLFAYVKFQSGMAMLQVIAAFAGIYFLEGYVIKPLVFKESMDLNPLMTIIVVMAFGELMGFWGILLAIPIAAAIKILSAHLKNGDFVAASEP